MIIQPDPPHYHSFLLRCWEERGDAPDAPAIWRFSLQDLRTGERHGFGSAAILLAAIPLMLAEAGAALIETDE